MHKVHVEVKGGGDEEQGKGAPQRALSPALTPCSSSAVAVATLDLLFVVDILEALALRPGAGE